MASDAAGSPLGIRTVTADSAGHFSVDFSDPAGGAAANMVTGDNVNVSIGDTENDRTHVQLLAR